MNTTSPLRFSAEERELQPARSAPRGPLVHDDGRAAFALDLLLERVHAARQERRRRRAVVARAASGEGHDKQQQSGQPAHRAKDGRALGDPISFHGVLQ
jgi:hypothetical protein